MIQVKLYLYNIAQESNEYRGTDLSAYVLSGAQNTENLTEELDVSEIVLQGYPERAEFAPETKFIVEVYQDDIRRYVYHRVVQEDVVEQPILSDEEYFTHTITLIEPSAIAQKRIVDDIAVSYKLKDVTLKQIPAFNQNRETETATSPTPPYQFSVGFGNKIAEESGFWQSYKIRHISFGKYFKWRTATDANDDQVLIRYTKTDDTVVTTNKYYTNINDIKVVDNKTKIQLVLPVPAIMWGKPDTDNVPPTNKGYAQIGYASFVCEVTETNTRGQSTVVLSERFTSSSLLNGNSAAHTDFPYSQFVNSYSYQYFRDEYLPERLYLTKEVNTIIGSTTVWCDYYFAKYTDRAGTDFSNAANRPITSAFEIKQDCTYDISLRVVNLIEADDIEGYINKKEESALYAVARFSRYTDPNLRAYSRSGYGYETRNYIVTQTTKVYAENVDVINDGNLPTENYSATSQLFSFASDSGTIMIQSATPYNALNLIKKAIANSSLYRKVQGVGADDFSANSPYPFYIESISGSDDNVVSETELRMTRINEAFYHQKNLWEILLEAGKYCHAIPQITFGSNDRFAISFYKLGTTNQKTTQATKISVMNFRKIDDYISACSSYVDNLVQLGGQIREIVPAKTSSEDFTVSNDTAEIIVSKPIIEILQVNAILTESLDYSYIDKDNASHSGSFPAGTKVDITPFIYEKSVYNLLSVKYDEEPNKGIALYYELGENSIRGGNYQLPQVTTNPYTDYAFKKVLWSALAGYPANLSRLSGSIGNSPWTDIKVNTFLFEVTYRTKDSARIESTRPDLRHYLLSSSKDEVPQHRQFNNQQDILVDSAAFGANMFGKLIRTGNSNYKMREWCNNTDEIKHKGELFIIENQWYYVAKVTNIFFPDHIESIVEYSKDYNQLSEIIGIPSEPRFYEISERSRIDREVQLNDYLLITTDRSKLNEDVEDWRRYAYIFGSIISGEDPYPYIKWAWTTFKGDPNINDENTFGGYDNEGHLFEKTVITPVNSYLCGNTLTFEWDMEDNFSAGNGVSEVEDKDIDTADSAYSVMRAVQYCDQYGKAALFDAKLSKYPPVFYPNGYDESQPNEGFVYDADQAQEVRVLPNSQITFTGDEEPTPILPLNNSVQINAPDNILLKDSREALHFNYNLMTITDSDRFILSPFLLEEKGENAGTMHFIFLSDEVSKFSDGYIPREKILGRTNVIVTTSYGTALFGFQPVIMPSIGIPIFTKAIALCNDPALTTNSDKVKFLVARNDKYTGTWYFGAPNKNNLFYPQTITLDLSAAP